MTGTLKETVPPTTVPIEPCHWRFQLSVSLERKIWSKVRDIYINPVPIKIPIAVPATPAKVPPPTCHMVTDFILSNEVPYVCAVDLFNAVITCCGTLINHEPSTFLSLTSCVLPTL